MGHTDLAERYSNHSALARKFKPGTPGWLRPLVDYAGASPQDIREFGSQDRIKLIVTLLRGREPDRRVPSR